MTRNSNVSNHIGFGIVIYLLAMLLGLFTLHKRASAQGKLDLAPTKTITVEPKIKSNKKGDKTVEATFMIEFNGETKKVVARIFKDKVPITAQNFIDLATGKKKGVAYKPGKPFYDGLIFHRVIPNFMIQGGCPEGTGMGSPGPGLEFANEIKDPKLNRHDKPGLLSMANKGKGTNSNGSQFFITVVPTPWLDDNHTIFGEVTEGLEHVIAISELPTHNSRPKSPVTIKSLTIKEG